MTIRITGNNAHGVILAALETARRHHVEWHEYDLLQRMDQVSDGYRVTDYKAVIRIR